MLDCVVEQRRDPSRRAAQAAKLPDDNSRDLARGQVYGELPPADLLFVASPDRDTDIRSLVNLYALAEIALLQLSILMVGRETDMTRHMFGHVRLSLRTRRFAVSLRLGRHADPTLMLLGAVAAGVQALTLASPDRPRLGGSHPDNCALSTSSDPDARPGLPLRIRPHNALRM